MADGLLQTGEYLLLLFGAGSIPLYLLTRDDGFKNLLKNCGLINKDGKYPLVINKKAKGPLIDYVLHLPPGLSIKDFETKREALSQGLGGPIELSKAQSGKLIMAVLKGSLGRMYPFEFIPGLKPVEFAIGYTQRGLLKLSLQDLDPHMAIGGTTNSGKSVFLKVIITAAALKPADELILWLIDLKRGVEFGIFEKSSRVANYAKDPETTLEVLDNLLEIMEDRLDLLAMRDVENIGEYNRKYKQKRMPYHLLVIDEFTLLKYVKGAHEKVEILLCQARAVGIHIIISLQTHHSENLPGTIKTNLGTIVSFKMRNKAHSEILLESGEAASLRGSGHGLLLAEGRLKEFQGFYIDSMTIKKLIGHTYIRKEKKEEKEQIGVMPSGTNEER